MVMENLADKITLFTTCKPCNELDLIHQSNAIGSWRALGFEVLILGNDEGSQELASSFDCQFIPDLERDTNNLPFIRSLFNTAFEQTTSEYVAYINSDIILDFSLKTALVKVLGCTDPQHPRLITSRRRSIPLMQRIKWDKDWERQVHLIDEKYGVWDHAHAIDLFIVNRNWLTDFPDIVVGRAGWDNWMLKNAQDHGAEIIDLSRVVKIYHPLHEYNIDGKLATTTFDSEGAIQNRLITRYISNSILDSASMVFTGAQLEPVSNADKIEDIDYFKPDLLKQYLADIMQLNSEPYYLQKPNKYRLLRTVLWRSGVFIPRLDVGELDDQQTSQIINKAWTLCESSNTEHSLAYCQDNLNQMLLDWLISSNREVIIWGTGEAGKSAALWLQRHELLSGFVDGLSEDGGELAIGDQVVPVFTAEDIFIASKRPILIIASMYYSEIIERIEAQDYQWKVDYLY